MSRWQQPRRDTSGRVIRSHMRFSTRTLLIFVVPLTDQNGVVIEQRVVPLRVTGPTRAVGDTRVVESAREVAAARVRPRVERLRRVLARLASREEAHADDVAAYLNGLLFPESVQPGIFDNRATRAALAADEQSTAIDQAAASRQAVTVSEIRIGRPRLVFDGRSRQ